MVSPKKSSASGSSRRRGSRIIERVSVDRDVDAQIERLYASSRSPPKDICGVLGRVLGTRFTKASHLGGGFDSEVFKVGGMRIVNLVKLKGKTDKSAVTSEAQFLNHVRQTVRMNRYLRKHPTTLFSIPRILKCVVVHVASGKAFGFVYLDHAKGSTFEGMTKNGPRRTIPDAYARRLGRILGWLHSRGIVHGDLDLADIVVGPRGASNPKASLQNVKFTIINWSACLMKSNAQKWEKLRRYDLLMSMPSDDLRFMKALADGYNREVSSPALRVDVKTLAMIRKNASQYRAANKSHLRAVKKRSLIKSLTK
jgi:tRNA A-37 threonylcarbamoyl transferase component Bud32